MKSVTKRLVGFFLLRIQAVAAQSGLSPTDAYARALVELRDGIIADIEKNPKLELKEKKKAQQFFRDLKGEEEALQFFRDMQ